MLALQNKLFSSYKTFLVVAAAYLAAAMGALLFTDGPNNTATIWMPSGIVLAALLLRPRSEYPQILAGTVISSLLSNYLIDGLFVQAVEFTIANVLEAVCAIAAMRAIGMTGISFEKPANVVDFAAICVLSTIASTTSAAILSGRYDAQFVGSWLITVLLGQLVCTPLLVTVGSKVGEVMRSRVSFWDSGMAVAIAINLAVAVTVFAQNTLPLLFLPVLPVLLATYRLGPIGAAIAVTIVAMVGSICTINGLGPCAQLAWGGMTEILFFQFYLVSLLAAALPLAAALATREAAARETEQQKRLFEMASGSAHIGHWQVNLADSRLFWSDEVFRIHQLPKSKMPSLDEALNFYHPDDRVRLIDMLDECIASGGDFAFDGRIITANGAVRHISSQGGAVAGPDGAATALFGVFQDITDRVLANEQLATAKTLAENRAFEAQILAETDALTSVANRRKIMAVLDQEIRRAEASGENLAIALMDIDYFKSINDVHGHSVGDKVLKCVADTSVRVLRGTDGFGRIGGEEFLVILPGAALDGAGRIVERLRMRVQEVTAKDNALPNTTVSIGVSAFSPGMTMEDFFSAADRALYSAKKDGRNLVMIG